MPLLSLYNDNEHNWKNVTAHQILELEGNLKRLQIKTTQKNLQLSTRNQIYNNSKNVMLSVGLAHGDESKNNHYGSNPLHFVSIFMTATYYCPVNHIHHRGPNFSSGLHSSHNFTFLALHTCNIIPRTKLAMRGSNGLARGP